jgi:hypothetical protein
MIESRGGVEPREPDQNIAELAVDVRQHKPELPRLRKPGLNVSHGKHREGVTFEPAPRMAVTGTRTSSV